MSGKLIFHHGTVCSSKTMMLLAIGHNYDSCGWKVCTVKPEIDTRSDLIETRAHVPPRKANIIIKTTESFYDYATTLNECDVVLIDECQFLTRSQVDELRNLSVERDIDILCFGLRTDFSSNLFEASKRLFELSDEIIEIKTICSICGKHASFNKKVKGSTDSQVDPGWDNFEPRCWRHFINEE